MELGPSASPYLEFVRNGVCVLVAGRGEVLVQP